MQWIRVLCPMLTYISASTVFPVSEPPVLNGVLAIGEQGYIKGVYQPEQARALGLHVDRHYEGALIPGFINTHCHLELSHLKGKIPIHTGLFRFVEQVMKNRFSGDVEIEAAMISADQEMFQNGIVAVGDISNVGLSSATKLNSRLYYHTFIEALGFNPAHAGKIISKALEIKAGFEPLKASVVPHAPYSVSDELFREISDLCESGENLISMHNQETAAEDEFFRTKSGDFLKLYEMLGLDLSFYSPGGKSSLQSTLSKLPLTKTLLVHNTRTTKEDVDFAKANHQHLYWCLCPNANLYIENTLPDVAMLVQQDLNITLGTDSLASNQQLSILKEMQTLQHHKGVDFEIMLKWATLNGASFLGIDNMYGSFDIGKKPGVLLLENMKDGKLSDSTQVQRLF